MEPVLLLSNVPLFRVFAMKHKLEARQSNCLLTCNTILMRRATATWRESSTCSNLCVDISTPLYKRKEEKEGIVSGAPNTPFKTKHNAKNGYKCEL